MVEYIQYCEYDGVGRVDHVRSTEVRERRMSAGGLCSKQSSEQHRGCETEGTRIVQP